MIVVKLQGGLGNQLFQLAFGVAQSQRERCSFVLAEGFGYSEMLASFFDLQNIKILKKISKKYSLKNQLEENQWIAPAKNLANFENQSNVLYDGYFQSEDYFLEHKNLIINSLKINKKYRIDARRWLGICDGRPCVAFHVRQEDYFSFGNDELGGKNLILPFDYYVNCWDTICKIFPNGFHAIWVAEKPLKDFQTSFFRFKKIENVTYHFVCYPQFVMDFQTLMQADIIVTANSTFSWWAAYLSKDKPIFAPENWLGFKINQEFPSKIIPTYWHKISTLPQHF